MRLPGLAVSVSLILVLAWGAVRLTEDKPLVAQPKGGRIQGQIASATPVSNLRAVSRASRQQYKPTRFDPRTGRFLFGQLPGDARYDLCFRVGPKREIEGIDLDFVDQRMLKLLALRRKQLDLPPERAHRFGPQDVEGLLAYVKEMKEFMEQRRVLYIRGQGTRATLLVELMRTRDFYDSGGAQYVWRVELWYFVNQFGGWDKLPNQERVLRRVRTTKAKWAAIGIEYYPQLSAYISPEGTCRPVTFRVPDKPDLSRGRMPGTAPNVQTPPHVLGVVSPKKTTTAPVAAGAKTSAPSDSGSRRLNPPR